MFERDYQGALADYRKFLAIDPDHKFVPDALKLADKVKGHIDKENDKEKRERKNVTEKT